MELLVEDEFGVGGVVLVKTRVGLDMVVVVIGAKYVEE